jgi:hypothetical protein
MTDVIDRVESEVNIEHLTERLEGRDGGLRPSKPTANGDDKLVQYVWRMARFHSPQGDSSIPVTAHWWLQDWVDDQGIDASVSGILDDSGKEIVDYLESVTDEVLDELGVDKFGAARDWKGKL